MNVNRICLRLLYAALLMVTGTAIASRAEEVPPELLDELCSNMGGFAEQIMARRQEGHAMSALRAAVLDPASPYYGVMSSVIVDAYKVSRFSTEEYRTRAIADFRNEVELVCYQTF